MSVNEHPDERVNEHPDERLSAHPETCVSAHALQRALCALFVRVYPLEFRAEYGAELSDAMARLGTQAARAGALACVRLWLRLAIDTVRSAPGEWLHAWRARTPDPLRPDYAGGAVAGLAVLLLYWLTLAPTTALWDAGEYITVAHTLGIAHPPGNALFVVLARAWDILLAPTGWPTAVRINVLSAAASALAHGFLFLGIERVLRAHPRGVRRIAASCAVLMSATAFTVWSQSNVNEKVYTISFVTVLATVWLVLRWRDTRNLRLLVLAAYVTALSMTNHLMGALVGPAVLCFVWRVDRRVLWQPRVWALTLPAVLLALSAQFFLPIRAAQQPLVNETDPTCSSLAAAAASIYTNGSRGCASLSATLRREQYQKPSITFDPTQPDRPRAASLVVSQFVNYVQYLDWQWARGLAGNKPFFGGARPAITLLVLLLVALGARTHWRADRDGALLFAVLLATVSAGLVIYMNFKYGHTIKRDVFPDPAMHEVRERDYFFLISFSMLGAWAGVGIASLWRAALTVLRGRIRCAQVAAAPVLGIALLPLALNWSWTSRANDWTTRDWAYNILMSVEPYGVLVTNGDNDSFPLWYLQHVEHIREDVTVVLGPYIGLEWYARQIRDISRPCASGVSPAADETRIICQRPFHSADAHPNLLAAWGGAPSHAPEDSILPLSDAEIARIAQDWFVVEQPRQLTFGELTGRVAAGTVITPVDTFVATIIQSTYGERPIHFMSPSDVVEKLGLTPHTVRVGLTWKLRERHDTDVVALPQTVEGGGLGQYVDVVTTDTLTRDVFLVRGRINDPALPWVDHASLSLPVQYAVMHYAAAVAHDVRGDAAGVQLHMERLNFWNRVLE